MSYSFVKLNSGILSYPIAVPTKVNHQAIKTICLHKIILECYPEIDCIEKFFIRM